MNKEITACSVALDYHDGQISKDFAVTVLVKLFYYTKESAEKYLYV